MDRATHTIVQQVEAMKRWSTPSPTTHGAAKEQREPLDLDRAGRGGAGAVSRRRATPWRRLWGAGRVERGPLALAPSGA